MRLSVLQGLCYVVGIGVAAVVGDVAEASVVVIIVIIVVVLVVRLILASVVIGRLSMLMLVVSCLQLLV